MITSYKELTVWQKSDRLAHSVFDLTETFPQRYQYDLTSQLRRAALSVPTNIAEGSASVHTKEFLQFLNISRRSLNETKYLLGFAYQRGLFDQKNFYNLESSCQEIGKMVNGLIKSLRNKTLNTKH